MVTTGKPQETNVDGAGMPAASTAIRAGGEAQGSRPTNEQVWRAIARASFAVISGVTPAGAPRSSGVVYTIVGRRMYVAVAPDSWKARQIAVNGRVAVTVPVRRGGVLALLFPIPPATVSFHATAIVHPAGSAGSEALSEARERLGPLVPAERRDSSAIIEIVPEGRFLTYGVGVPLMQLRNPAIAGARVPVS